FHRERPDPRNFDDRLALDGCEMRHLLRRHGVTTGGEALHRLVIPLLAHADHERPLDHREMFIAWMGVRRHAIAVRGLEPDDEEFTGLARIPCENGDTRP